MAIVGIGRSMSSRFVYDFAKHGGAIGAKALEAAYSVNNIPKDAIILDGVMEVMTPLTSLGAATVGVHVQVAGDIVAVAPFGGAPWSTAGLKDIVPAGTAATAIKTTADRLVSFVIAGAALTAGKVVIVLRYVLVGEA